MIDLKKLKPGDLVRHTTTGEAHVVIYRGDQPIAVRAVSVVNPPEWEECNPAIYGADHFFRTFEAKLVAHNFNPMLIDAFIASLRQFYGDPNLTGLLRLAKVALSCVA